LTRVLCLQRGAMREARGAGSQGSGKKDRGAELSFDQPPPGASAPPLLDQGGELGARYARFGGSPLTTNSSL
jgi:hypothetical protein